MLKAFTSLLLLFFVQVLALVRITESRRFGKPGGGYYAVDDEVEVNDEAAHFLVNVQKIAVLAGKKSDSETSKPSAEETATSDLPDDFPARALLINAELDTLAKVQAADDDQLTAISGIAAGTLEKIRAAAKS